MATEWATLDGVEMWMDVSMLVLWEAFRFWICVWKLTLTNAKGQVVECWATTILFGDTIIFEMNNLQDDALTIMNLNMLQIIWI